MATRTSIELHADGCRLAEVYLSAGRRADAGEARVRAFGAVSALPDSPALSEGLAGQRSRAKLGRRTWVTIWGLRSAQQFLRLPPAKPADLEVLAAREARKDIATLETDGDRASVGVMVGGEVTVGTHRRREVSLVALSTGEIRKRIQPIVDAGFVVEGVLTPALALTAVARAERGTAPGSAGAYVALTAKATCVAIVRDGLLLFARELPWGYDAEPAAGAVSARLASELRRSVLFFKQTFRASVDRVVVCGDMPELRALTAPLGEAMSLPVQAADSLAGLDAASIPEPAAQFRAEVAALRLAIATGAEVVPPINLLPASIRVGRESRARTLRLSSSVAASLAMVAAAYVFAGRTSGQYETEKTIIQDELASLEPEARRRDELRLAYTLAASQGLALDAFNSQGPRLTRFLEALSAATPDEIVLRSVTAEADGMRWNTTVTGIAVTPDAASGQAAVNALLRRLADSPFAGPPVSPPSLRMVSGSGAATGTSGDAVQPLADGMSGVEFELRLRVEK
jgi:hypothetical protein